MLWLKNYVPLIGEQEHTALGSVGAMPTVRSQISLAAIPLLLWNSLQLISVLTLTTNRLGHSLTCNWWKLPLKSLTLLGIKIRAVLIGILLPEVVGLIRELVMTLLGFPAWILQIIPWLALF